MNRVILLIFFSFLLSTIHGQRLLVDQIDDFYEGHITDGSVDYSKAQNSLVLKEIVKSIAIADLSNFNDSEKLSFYINSYNILAIQSVLDQFPISSVQDIAGFFDRDRIVVASRKLSLNKLEKDLIFGLSKDPRLHFALVCAAKGCPKIRAFAYRSDLLDDQLDQAARLALTESNTMNVDMEQNIIYHSKIFSWYKNDFGGDLGIRDFIQKYSNQQTIAYKLRSMDYDWGLNEYVDDDFFIPLANNSFRYISSATVPKGGIELKVFNNLYSQSDNFNRSTFFTMINSFLYGVKSNFNAGFDLRYRRVYNDVASTSPFAVFGTLDNKGRQGVTTIGPKIRWAPLAQQLPNFSIQSAFWFAIGDNLQGNSDSPFIDWDSHTWITQLFNDQSLGDQFSLFTELDFIIEDIGRGESNRFSTPATVILSYFPIPNVTVYGIGGYSPFWSSDFDYFYQVGAGAKYQIHPNLEFELLYTHFNNKFLRSVDGGAATYNFGIRYSYN